MQNIVIDKPYSFVAPQKGSFWLKLIHLYLPRYLRRKHGIASWEIRGSEHLKRSIDEGHGIMLAPNHCRPCDPMVLAMMAKKLEKRMYIMGSWHLFMQDKLFRWLLPRLGVFSVYREGSDREALKFAVKALSEAKRMLVIFPEGLVSRTNDRLNNLMEGTAFIARSAAKRRAAINATQKTVVHPVAMRYFFDGDLEATATPVIEDIERRLTLKPRSKDTLLERIKHIGIALLSVKEIEYFGESQIGSLEQRLAALIDRLLIPLEKEWLNGQREEDLVLRVKKLRIAILPAMTTGELTDNEKKLRWRQLEDIYLAQQLYLYPSGYLESDPASEQILETIERFEEDITDAARIHYPIRAVMEIGEAIEVTPERDRASNTDPLMKAIENSLAKMLKKLKGEQSPKVLKTKKTAEPE